MEQCAQRRVPDLIDLVHDRRDSGIAGGSERNLAHDREDLRLFATQPAKTIEVRSKQHGGATFGRKRCAEPSERVLDHASDERLLRGEVVMKRGDVHSDRPGYVASTQAFEAALRE